jgi:hypothetical protein
MKIMNQQNAVLRNRYRWLSSALILLIASGVLVGSARQAAASVHLLYFRATAGNNSILLEWETASEQEIVAFNLYRSEDSGSRGQQIGDTFPAKGDSITGAKYSYLDTDVVPGVRYYYSLEKVAASGGLTIIAWANAGIGSMRRLYLPMVVR